MYLRTFLLRCGYFLLVTLCGLRGAHGQFVVPGPGLRLHGFVFAVESDDAGNVYLGGSFDEFNGGTSSGMGLLRLTSGGAKHATWDIGFIEGVTDLLVHGNFLYVAGSFSTVRTLSAGTLNRPYLLRIFLTGGDEGKVDTTWVPVINSPVSAIETDGTSLFLAGTFSVVNGTSRARLAKLLLSSGDPDGLDGTWDPAPNNRVNGLKYVSPSLYVSGDFTSIGGLASNYLVRLSATGSGAADVAWKPEVDRPVSALESNGTHLYFGGDFTTVEGSPHRCLGRYSTAVGAAVIDGSWKPDPDGEVSSMALCGSSLYIGGVFTTVASAPRQFMAKVAASGSGSVDGAFLPQPNGAIKDMKAIGSDVVVGGRFNTTNGAASAGYAMMNGTSGAALASFAGTLSTKGQIHAIEPVTGGVVIGGWFDSVGGVARTSIAKIQSNGTLDPSFNAPLVGFNRLVSDIKQDGTHLYLCGDFLSVGGAATQHIARVNASTGAVDAGWLTKPLTPLLCLETDASYVYFGSAGLRFVEIAPNNKVEVHNLARVSKGTPATLDQAWNPYIVDQNSNPATASVLDMRMNGGNLIIGGHFAFVVNPNNLFEAYQRICMASLPTTGWGQPNAGWGSTLLDERSELGSVSTLLLHNGALYAAGNFVNVNGNPWYYMAKFDPTSGAWDSSFDASPIDSLDPLGPAKVSALAGSADHLYIAGSFDHVFTNSPGDGFDLSPNIARVNATSGMLDPSWYPYPDDPVTCLATVDSNLWASGSFTEIGGCLVEGPVILTPFTAPYQAWLNAYFLPAEVSNPNLTAPFWDLDGDGDSNLVEATFNTDPFNGCKTYHVAGTGTGGLPLLRSENFSGQLYLTMEFTRWKTSANAGIAVTPQFGDNLTNWPRNGTVLSTTSLDANRERVKIRDTIPNLPRAFGRVHLKTQAQ